ncbi:ATPase [Actinobacillus pleuropneumoniae]|nr:ATPase [Actinobacillus pleuropneumoniae]
MIASIFGTKKKKDQTVAEQVVSEVTKSVAKKLTNQVSKQIMRGILGAILSNCCFTTICLLQAVVFVKFFCKNDRCYFIEIIVNLTLLKC